MPGGDTGQAADSGEERKGLGRQGQAEPRQEKSAPSHLQRGAGQVGAHQLPKPQIRNDCEDTGFFTTFFLLYYYTIVRS